MRVVSLLPAATEICFALDVEPVAVSQACDYPPRVQSLPVVDRSRVSNEGSSGSVNEQVAAAGEAGGVYEIDRETLAAADPDLVIAQGICEVCAIDESVAHDAVAAAGLDADVLSLHSHTLAGALGDIERVGRRLERPAMVAGLIDDLRARINKVTAASRAIASRPRVAVVDWMRPVMVAGHWVPELIERASGQYGLADAGDRSTVREWSAIHAYDPEVLVAAPCGFGLDRTAEHVTELTDRDGWNELAAVRAGRVYAMDGNHYVNRPGPRLVETLEYLAAVIHPNRFGAPPDDVVASIEAKPGPGRSQ